MNCANHPEVNASAFCRECGKPMCVECQRPAFGSVYCPEHLPVNASAQQPPPLPGFSGSTYQSAFPGQAFPGQAAGPTPGSPYSAPLTTGPVPDPAVHPALALILGFAPGVGAIYNGQYAKGLIHAVVFGLLISLLNNVHNSGSDAFIAIMMGIWVIYQAFEAYHTARKRRYGIAVEEFSSLFEVRHTHGRFPIGALLLIVVGFILLLDTTDIVNMAQFERYWPVLLIGAGAYMLYVRLNPAATTGSHGHTQEGGVR